MWNSIESAPKDGTSVILFFPCLKCPVQIGRYLITEHFVNGELEYRSEKWFAGLPIIGFGDEPEPTHWMAIPSVP